MEIGLAWGQRPAPAGRSQGSLEASAGRGPLTGAQLCVAGPPWPEAGGGGSGCPEGGPRSCGRVGTSWRAGISCWHGSVVNVVRTGTSRAGDIRAKGTLNGRG